MEHLGDLSLEHPFSSQHFWKGIPYFLFIDFAKTVLLCNSMIFHRNASKQSRSLSETPFLTEIRKIKMEEWVLNSLPAKR